MGEFSDKIVILTDNELNDVWLKITSYQSVYIDDFLSELMNRGLRDDYLARLSDLSLISITLKLNKLENSKNVQFLNLHIKERGLSVSESSFVEENNKNKVNYTIPTAGIAILIVVIIKLLARNAGEELKEQSQNNQNNNIEVILYGEDGILKTKINSYKHYLDSVKVASPSFLLSAEKINEIILTEENEMKNVIKKIASENFKKKNDLFEQQTSDFLMTYKIELSRLLYSYSESEEMKNNNIVLDEK
jgi:hypothetical protein